MYETLYRMYKYTRKIRDLINNPRKQFNLLKNLKFWNQLCSSLDVIEDADLAIEAYLKGTFPKDDGVKYLQLYGVLQALFIQQDAVEHLCESLSLPKFNPRADAMLSKIRDIRNASIGHPTRKDRPKSKPVTYHYISRPTILKQSFQLISFDGSGKPGLENIDLGNMISNQRTILAGILQKTAQKLRSEERLHKGKFRMDKLKKIFSQAHYFVEKIYDGLKEPAMGKVGLNMVREEVLAKFKSKLKERGLSIDTYDSIKHIFEILEYPISELIVFFESSDKGKKPNITPQTAYIFQFFIRKQIEALEEIAKEIDAEYSS